MSDDRIRDGEEGAISPPEGGAEAAAPGPAPAGPDGEPAAAAGQGEEPAAAAGEPEPDRRGDVIPIRPRPLPPTWMDLPPEDVERLTRQVQRAFSSEPFQLPHPEGQEPSSKTPAAAAQPSDAAGAPASPAPAQERAPGDLQEASEAGTAPSGAGAGEGSRPEPTADPEAGLAPPAGASRGREEARRRRRGSRGRGRRKRREEETAGLVEENAVEALADPEHSFAEAARVVELPAEPAAAGPRPSQPAAVGPSPGEAAAAAGEPGGGAEPQAPGEESELRPRRRRGRRRGRERADRAAARAGSAAEGAVTRQEEPDAETDGHEAERLALEAALRAEQPQSAEEIGAFDEREQALLKGAWPDGPVREGQGQIRRRSQHGLSMEETFEARRDRMAEERRSRKGTLYLVATPIGNVEDLTFRAVRILKEVKLIAAEDTRQAAKLLGHYQIRTPLVSFVDHKEQVKTDFLIRKLEDGQSVALVSDSGTPGISDPGQAVVKAAIERGVRIVPVPGACAALAALSVSGLPTESWAFVGSLPQKEKKRREVLESLKLDRRTLVFYEAPGRAFDTIKELCEVLGNRDMALVREVTKAHEEVVRGKFSRVLAEYRGKEVKGEVVIVVGGWSGKSAEREGLSILDRVRLYKQESGLPLADVVRLVARETGTPKSEVYRESLRLAGVDPERLQARKPAEPGGVPEAAAREAAGQEAVGQEAEVSPVPLPEAMPLASEPDLAPEPDARSRIVADAEPDAPLVDEVAGETPGGRAGNGAGAAAGNGVTEEREKPPVPGEGAAGLREELPGVEVVEGRPGSAPEIPLAPRQE